MKKYSDIGTVSVSPVKTRSELKLNIDKLSEKLFVSLNK